MNKVLRVELTEEERRDLNKYLINFPFGQISYILRHAVRDFIKREKEREQSQLKELEAQSGSQGSKGKRIKKA